MKIILGISGANGTALAKTAIDKLGESHSLFVAATEQGERRFFEECGIELYDFLRRRQKVTRLNNTDRETASNADVMLFLPCSSAEAAKTASGCSDSLLTYAADRMLCRKKPLVLAVGETMLSAVTLKNLERLSALGATVCPLVPILSDRNHCENTLEPILQRLLSDCEISI